jgi:diguanylate cyclase (GGDEF)-like protein
MTEPEQSRLGMLESVLDAMNLGTVVIDRARTIVAWNGWMARHAGVDAATALGRDFFAVFPELAGKRVEHAVLQALRDNFPSVLSQTLHKAPFPLYANAAARAAGTRLQQAIAVTPLRIPGGARHCLVQVTDVTVAVNRETLLREQALELRSQSFSDGLTGIANRRHFDVVIDKEMRRAKRAGLPLSLLMIDIDSFKAYNDHYGHQLGDDTLIRVATTLAAMLKRPLDAIARYGGEEFAVILPELDAAQAAHVAETLRAQIAALAIAHAGSECADHVTVSIGIATRSHAQPFEVPLLIGAADRALYLAKRNGRNQVVTHMAKHDSIRIAP